MLGHLPTRSQVERLCTGSPGESQRENWAITIKKSNKIRCRPQYQKQKKIISIICIYTPSCVPVRGPRLDICQKISRSKLYKNSYT